VDPAKSDAKGHLANLASLEKNYVNEQ